MNIAVCEDDKGILDLIGIIIVGMGHEMHRSSNGVALLNVLKGNTINLIVLDYWLKEGKTDKLIVEVKANYKKVPIILMSAINSINEIQAELKVDDYIKKPFDIEEFKSKIRNLIE